MTQFLDEKSTTKPPAQTLLTTQTPLATVPATIKVNQIANADGPVAKYQLSEQLLYEHDFHGHTYVSAHLQRLQHGVYDTDNTHAKSPLHVTFVSINFTMHPAVSSAHRFSSAVVEVSARSEARDPLRFVMFAPHLAYGRISSQSLKWSFQLGAALGVTQGPVDLSVNPQYRTESEKVVGTMMKIQGSTRSQNISGSNKRIPDTKIVWSLEENDQQESGLPREFTFVCLIARPAKSSPLTEKTGSNKHDSAPHKAHSLLGFVSETAAHHEADLLGDIDHGTTFGPFYLGIRVKPQISNNMMTGFVSGGDEVQETKIEHEIGQRLRNEHVQLNPASRISSINSTTEGYYNFANIPGSFEDLIELPGNVITTVEPTLPSKC